MNYSQIAYIKLNTPLKPLGTRPTVPLAPSRERE
jgi:hypothetical protein